MDKLKSGILDVTMFINRVDYELKRAERYSIFMSLVVFDLSFLKENLEVNYEKTSTDLYGLVTKKVRTIDIVSLLGDSQLALLFPETNRQGAEIVSKRVNQIIKDSVESIGYNKKDYIIPMEMASYPDTAGTSTISQFLQEYSDFNLN